MAIVTSTEVFDFCGTPADVRTTQGAMVTALIDRVQEDVQVEISRPIDAYHFVDLRLFRVTNCRIIDQSIYLYGLIADTYLLTNVKIDGQIVSDYQYNMQGSEIIRNNLLSWPTNQFITLTGSSRLGGISGSQSIKQIIMELVAIRAGIWKKAILTEGGMIQVERSFEKRWKQLQKFKRSIY